MNISLFLIGTLIGLINGLPYQQDSVTEKQQAADYRLPTLVIPSHYDIELTPYLAANDPKPLFTFDGVVHITLNTTEQNVREIVLHAHNLDIVNSANTLVESKGGVTSIAIVGRENNLITSKLTLTLATALKPNVDYKLSFVYSGQLNSDMTGFYRSSYVSSNGQTRWIATTQMQPTHARKVFPCFDEPAFKATFLISINRRPEYLPTVSNTRIFNSVEDQTPGFITDNFRQTPRMSTYLIAFIVSDFRLRENVFKTFRVLARPDAFSQTEYAHEIGQKTLSKLEDWVDFKYTSVPEIEKMDMAALPDFSAGAMENWGLLTYRETALLYDADVSTALAQQRVATVIAHEQAHMWFGDLVTCDWWKFTWLNEGFARFFQYFGTALVETTWDLDLQFVVEQLQVVLNTDSDESTHPLTHDVNTPSEISGIFDNISYNKGASVIRMIQHVIGFDKFQAALREYLKTNKFTTGTPEKLYASLQKEAGETINIATFLNTWTTQAGYPVVTVELQDDKRNLHISQKRFLLKNKNHNDATLWDIPLNYASPDHGFTATESMFTLGRTQKEMNVELQTETDWVIFNVQQTGFYRVNYDTKTWNNIAEALKNTSYSGIHVLNRAQIVDDALNLARADYIDYDLALNLIQYIEDEDNYLPWLAAFNNLPYLSRRLNSKDLGIYKKYLLKLIEKIYEKLGFDEKETDKRIDIYNRANILSYACKYGHEGCISSAKAEFDKLESINSRVPVNIRPVVYCTAIAEGGNGEWSFMWDKFTKENVAAEQVVILNALGCTRDKAILTRYLDNILTDDIRLQDKSAAFSATYNGPEENVQIVLEYVFANYLKIRDAFGGINDVASILSNLAARFTQQSQVDQLLKFWNDNQSDFGASQSIPTAIENAKFNLKWADDHLPIIVKYMETNGSNGLASISTVLILFTAIYHLFF